MQATLMLLTGVLGFEPTSEPVPPALAAPGDTEQTEPEQATSSPSEPAPDPEPRVEGSATGTTSPSEGEPLESGEAVDAAGPIEGAPVEAEEVAKPDAPVEPDVAAEPDAAAKPDVAAEPDAAAKPDEPAKPGSVRLTAFADLAYIFNSNFPDNHVYRGAYTSPRTNELALNLAGLWLVREADERVPLWLEVGFHAGAAADANYASEPTPGGANSQFAGLEAFKHVSLANAGVKLRSGTDLGGGLFSSPVGIGSLFAKDNWLYTNAWESNWVPYYLMGARIGQDLPAGFRIEGWVVNGFQMVGDLNQVPSYMVSGYWSKGDVSVAQHVFFGPEQERIDARGWLVHSDTQVVWDTERLGVAALWDVGQERSLDEMSPGTAVWTGGQASLRAAALRRNHLRLDIVARPELWWDSRGRTFGNDGYLVSGTAGLALFGFERSIALHVEYRYDWSSDPRGYFFRGGATAPEVSGLASDQHNVVLSLVGALDYRLPRLR